MRHLCLLIDNNYLDRSVDKFTKDIKTNLLPEKSAIALSNRPNSCRQTTKTVDEFGQEIEYLLSEITISQSEGDSNAASVLGKVYKNWLLRLLQTD